MHEGLPALLDLLREDPAVRLVYVFGSVARGEAHAGSDLDVGVLLAARPSFEDERRLRAAVADAAGGAPVDLVVLNDAGPVLLHEVIEGGRCVWARSEAEQAEFEIVGLSRYLDWQPVLRVQEAYRRARVEARRGAAR